MAAINPAVAAPYSMGVHRNTAAQSHKAMAAANPAVKYGRAASILSTPTQTHASFGAFTVMTHDLKLEGLINWKGCGEPPETIAQNQSASEFRHSLFRILSEIRLGGLLPGATAKISPSLTRCIVRLMKQVKEKLSEVR
ncbi:hypothetical protein ES319_D06G217200v1 [Gossypium barbadense]|uniref:Uncharacterized protein n=1 Tax=Gossypium barbadense TaxID=3634 RepID=A0A5J5R5L9_GOSBA|nr:hypothetical protein ES319_D06G217200v1 [Gossypium barbadense]